MSVAHSKSAVPSDVLDDRVAFRRLLQRVVFTNLDDLRAAAQLPRATDTSPMPADANTASYDDPSRSFEWLTAHERAAGRARRRRRGQPPRAACGGRAAPTRNRPAHVRWVRGLHGCRDGPCRVHAAPGNGRRRVRDHLRRPPRRRRGQHERRVRDAAGPLAHRLPSGRLRQQGGRRAGGGERRGRDRRHPGGCHPVVRWGLGRGRPDRPEPLDRRRADPARTPRRSAGLCRRCPDAGRGPRPGHRPTPCDGRRHRGCGTSRTAAAFSPPRRSTAPGQRPTSCFD